MVQPVLIKFQASTMENVDREVSISVETLDTKLTRHGGDHLLCKLSTRRILKFLLAVILLSEILTTVLAEDQSRLDHHNNITEIKADQKFKNFNYIKNPNVSLLNEESKSYKQKIQRKYKDFLRHRNRPPSHVKQNTYVNSHRKRKSRSIRDNEIVRDAISKRNRAIVVPKSAERDVPKSDQSLVDSGDLNISKLISYTKSQGKREKVTTPVTPQIGSITKTESTNKSPMNSPFINDLPNKKDELDADASFVENLLRSTEKPKSFIIPRFGDSEVSDLSKKDKIISSDEIRVRSAIKVRVAKQDDDHPFTFTEDNSLKNFTGEQTVKSSEGTSEYSTEPSSVTTEGPRNINLTVTLIKDDETSNQNSTVHVNNINETTAIINAAYNGTSNTTEIPVTLETYTITEPKSLIYNKTNEIKTTSKTTEQPVWTKSITTTTRTKVPDLKSDSFLVYLVTDKNNLKENSSAAQNQNIGKSKSSEFKRNTTTEEITTVPITTIETTFITNRKESINITEKFNVTETTLTTQINNSTVTIRIPKEVTSTEDPYQELIIDESGWTHETNKSGKPTVSKSVEKKEITYPDTAGITTCLVFLCISLLAITVTAYVLCRLSKGIPDEDAVRPRSARFRYSFVGSR